MRFLRRGVLPGLVVWLTVIACGLLLSEPAGAAVTHEFLPEPSTKFSEDGLGSVDAMTIDSGEVYVGEEGSRLEKFDASTGALVAPFPAPPGSIRGIAVGSSTGEPEVYVRGEGGVSVFDPAGSLQNTWTGADTPSLSFASDEIDHGDIAVDDSGSLSWAAGDVYVADREDRVVDVFEPKAGGGEEYVTRLEGPEAPNVLFTGPISVAANQSNDEVLVVDREEGSESAKTVDVFKPAVLRGQYEFVGKLIGPPGSLEHVVGVTVDNGVGPGSGDIYVLNGNLREGQPEVVEQFDSAGEFLGEVAGTPTGHFGGVNSVAVDPASHDLYVGDAGGRTVDVFGPDLVIPDVTTEEALNVKATSATLTGTVNPDEAGPATCEFEYGTSTSYGEKTECLGLGSKATPIKGGPGETSPVVVQSKTVEGLQPDTTYFDRLDATNEKAGKPHTNTGGCPADCGQFKTSGPGLHGESASEVASNAASLDATIDPDGSPTSYYFQYSTASTAGCEASVSPPANSGACLNVPPEGIGSVPGDVHVSQRIQGLSPETVYHYRVVVLSEAKPGDTEIFSEPDQMLTTQPAGSGFALPDGREWELVSPPDKHGATLLPLNTLSEGYVTESSSSGDAFTYLASNPTEENPPGFFDREQILSTRGPGGWSSQNISLPHSRPVQPTAGEGQEYRFFSDDLSLGLAEAFEPTAGEQFTSLEPFVFPPDSERTPYLRHDLTCQATPSTCYAPLVTGAPGYADVPEGTIFGEGEHRGGVRFVGATPDLAHVVLHAEAPLKSGAPDGALYEFSAAAPGEDELKTVSVLPEGGGVVGERSELAEEPERNEPTINKEALSARWAISADGSRVVWESAHRLYLTDMADERSVALDVPEAACEECAVGQPQFQIADREGSRVFFSDSQRLLKGAGVGDLYECEVALEPSGPRCVLRDVAPGASVVGGVLGASEDGSYVYFVSNSVSGDGAEHGAITGNCTVVHLESSERGAYAGESCNLYMLHYDGATQTWEAPVLIAALSGADGKDWNPGVFAQTARVSPDGGWLAFMSQRSLTGYDNVDVSHAESETFLRSGVMTTVHHDQEVFLYHAHPGASGSLVCASCNPTGARPAGVEQGIGVRLISGNDTVFPDTTWLAANIPGWTPFSLERARYQSRFLSDEGRLFFNSSDALVPQDINHNEDVYEFEPAGVGGEGGCRESSSTFNRGTGGCVGLISSGTFAQESAFLDASAVGPGGHEGEDVFFLSGEKLSSRDTDSAYDVYDAHVCTTQSPCASSPASSPACTTADACRGAVPPQPQIFGAAGPTETFTGAGNLAPPPPVKKTAAQIKAEKLANALKACRKDRSKKKRRTCEVSARKRYGTAKKATHHRRVK